MANILKKEIKMKRILLIIALIIVIPCTCLAVMPDMVAAINTALSSLTTEQKQAILDDYCDARGYTETIKDAEGKDVPQTKKAFMNKDISQRIKTIIENYRKQQAFKNVTIENLELTE